VTVTPPTRRGERVTQDKIVAATAELLESRDASRVTVAVIAKHAGISQATFYRYFRDRKAAFTAALSHLCDRTISALPSLEDHAVCTRSEESCRIFSWIESLHRSLLRQRAFRWSFSNSEHSKAKAQIERSMLKVVGGVLTPSRRGRTRARQGRRRARGSDPGRLPRRDTLAAERRRARRGTSRRAAGGVSADRTRSVLPPELQDALASR
jgi:AcrR family transcriptional regulator